MVSHTMLERRRYSAHLVFNLWVLILMCDVNAVLSKSSVSDDGKALMVFKSEADLWNKLFGFSKNSTSRFCQWQGVTCFEYRVERLVIEDIYLGGVLASNSLSRLDQLRVLSLKNNSLTGPIPDLSGLFNLKSLFLDHNYFSGSFPQSIASLHRLRTLDLSHNNFTGSIPAALTSLDRLNFLRLDSNRFNGTIPQLNQSSLQTFNVSVNNLTGAIPVTPTLLRFTQSSFSNNPNLCGEIVRRECHPRSSFFSPKSGTPAVPDSPDISLGQNEKVHGVELRKPHTAQYKRNAMIIGFSSGLFILICSVLCFVFAARKQKDHRLTHNQTAKQSTAVIASEAAETAEAAAVIQFEQENELEEKVKKVQGLQVAKSGNLVFCAGESQLYTLDQLMRGSAELLSRGTLGTTYKAVLDNRLIVCVKRLDGSRLAGASKEEFARHMESVGGLRHPNLVPLRAYFQAKEERILVYDYQPNGSLSSLIHGTKSTRAKPLHWTSCLKIAEDVAQGLSYIHQAWRLVHGNLKSSNVLLGPDFEACVADYCLAALATSPDDLTHDAISYIAPETRNSPDVYQEATSKTDVYAFGVLLVELLTGKPPSQHPSLVPEDMVRWVKSSRKDDYLVGGGDSDGGGGGGEEDGGKEDERMNMLVEVAIVCSLTSPEQRPTMWQVLKMLQEIKEVVLGEDDELGHRSLAS